MKITPDILKRMRACTAFDMPSDAQIALLDHVDALQQHVNALSAKGLELCYEAEQVYGKYNVTQMPDMDLVDGKTIQEFFDLATNLREGDKS